MLQGDTIEKVSPRGPNPVDVHVGSRIRLRRQLLRMSQEKLGDELGVTFQQVQKYERGANRVGASRLYRLSRVLEVPVQFFFEGLNDQESMGMMAENDQTPIVYDFIQSSDGVSLAESFSRIKDAKVRRRVLELVRTLASEEEMAR
ncbi:MAG: helix-turn-helix transcriptional regulator [Maricaulis sp.]|uniref:helix-turn-helix domain-containing protein n=1 Tax=Maricaulis sp. TaxID=1486257 RepID=UPI001B263A59|nr:helix-turn-helix transcriptional regulator [Maricaulis sp.]MBO6728838.1 helix-turn-helix transcriptional regulator [Maricaulis sp.]MBO6846169.1 helix-turn-helix transcriptional regulator [Maricaulis sp.]MBO6875954.1 helix-turn-helix transcriptional regulator [Maricaulis sp.]